MPPDVQYQLPFPPPLLLPLLTPDEIYARADEKLLRVLSEDRRIEWKSARVDGRALGMYFSMWANTRPGGGLIVIGIEKDGRISGCSHLSSPELNAFDKVGRDYCPDARPDSKRISVVAESGASDFVILIRVPYREDKVVTTSSGDAFVRIGDDKKQLSSEEIRELQIDKRELDLERELASDLVWPNDFNQEVVSEFCKSVREKWSLDGGQSNDEILSHRRLGKIINGRFVPNTACVLVFGNDPTEKFPGCMVRFLRYDGEVEKTGEHYNVIKDIPIEGAIPALIERTAKVLESQLRDFSALGKDGKFYTVPEYPYSAWYEAVVNACVHRSYGLKNRPVFVKMFDDKLVIESPGAFPPTVTPQNIYESHHPRNPTMMDALKYLDFVKCHNEGTRRMRDTMTESKLPLPEFEQKGIDGGAFAVRVTLRNNAKSRKAYVDSSLLVSLGESVLKDMDERERMILNFVATNGTINVSQCQRQLGFPRWHASSKFLQKMVARGYLSYHKHSQKERSQSYFTISPRKGK